MPRNDEGEFELVLGNKQLLSVFFIVVVLLGVFFTMGYIVGRNSSTDAAAQLAAIPGQPLVVEPEGGSVSSPPETAAETAAPPPPAARETARREEPPPAEEPPPKPPETARAAPPPPLVRTPAPVTGASEPRSGQTFLQVAATSRNEGELLLDVLGKRGFKGQLAQVPDQDLFRVLIGPVDGAEDLSKTRTALQAAGFKPFTRKY